ncbi:MAG: cation-translocating P-type ATPase [Anaerolineales bacterium]|nr:cation-translocating P-type ATPase [Anaerolineales bacterium]
MAPALDSKQTSTSAGDWLDAPPYQLPIDAVLSTLMVDPKTGLTSADARTRVERYGKNELPETPPVPAWRKFLAQFQNPLTVLLLVAIVISLVAWIIEHEEPIPFEALTITAIVLLNAVLGYYQERRAEEAVSALQAMSAPTARVLRDGESQTIPAADVVPGDVLLIEEGDTLPADARVIESIALRVAESALTGESTPVSKDVARIPAEAGVGDQQNMVFSSTAVTAGRGRAVVTTSGAATEIGRIAGTLQETEDEETPLQHELDFVGKTLGVIVVVIAVAMSATLLFVNRGQTSITQFVDILLLGVSLAVAAVPEGLTAITTIVLSLGMQRMATRNVIVRKLSAVETLGSTTVINTDKTGTLTKNEMTVRSVELPAGRFDLTGIGYDPTGEVQRDGAAVTDPNALQQVRVLLAVGALANNADLIHKDDQWTIQGDPTEGALLVAAQKLGISEDMLAERFTRIGEVPFSSERKMMSAVFTDVQRQTEVAVASKGAPDVLLARCTHERVGDDEVPLTAERVTEIQAGIDAMAKTALRTIGVAYRYLHSNSDQGDYSEEQEQEMVFVGVVGMIDPPRPEAAAAVDVAKRAGIRTIMITGDHPTTAAAIAAELGIADANNTAVTGMELQRIDDETLRSVVKKSSVFARVAPEHKLRIVRALKADGEIAAMTGDGVNDAPALKAADIGVAMGITGTDVSKGAADMILTDDNFASIVAAVEEGRSIFANIQKFLRYLLSSNVGEVMVMFFGVILAGVINLVAEEDTGLIAPLLATQILWINLVTDSGPALALGLEPADPDVMRKARDPRKRVIDRPMWLDIFGIGLVMAIATLAVIDWGLPGGLIAGRAGSVHYAQTLAFTTLVFAQLFNAFNARSSEASVFHHLFTNKWLWGAVALGALLQIAVVYMPFLQRPFGTVPLDAVDWAVCIGAASLVLWTRRL